MKTDFWNVTPVTFSKNILHLFAHLKKIILYSFTAITILNTFNSMASSIISDGHENRFSKCNTRHILEENELKLGWFSWMCLLLCIRYLKQSYITFYILFKCQFPLMLMGGCGNYNYCHVYS